MFSDVQESASPLSGSCCYCFCRVALGSWLLPLREKQVTLVILLERVVAFVVCRDLCCRDDLVIVGERLLSLWFAADRLN